MGTYCKRRTLSLNIELESLQDDDLVVLDLTALTSRQVVKNQ